MGSSVAIEPLEGRRLLSSTAALIKDINTNTQTAYVHGALSFNGSLYFLSFDPTSGYGLWRSDGTAAGTAPVKVVQPRPGTYAMSFLTDLVVYNGALYYANLDDAHGWELWRSDGTAAGTTMVKDLFPGSADSDPEGLTVAGGKLTFFTHDTPGGQGWAIWSSDGTDAGTQIIATIPGPAPYDHLFADDFGSANGLMFARLASLSGTGVWSVAVWRSDGTAAGTYQVASGLGNPGSVGGPHAFALGTKYAILTGTAQMSLFDGSVGGVTQAYLTNTPGGGAAANSAVLGVMGGYVYYGANGVGSAQIFRSAGTSTYATLLNTSNVASFAATDSLVATTGGNGYLTESGGSLHRYLYQVSSAGALTQVADFPSATTAMANLFYSPSEQLAYFSMGDSATGAELWKTNGTAAGTVRVADIRPGTGGSSPQAFLEFNGKVYFLADDGTHGQEFWSTDGTAAGTQLMYDVNQATVDSFAASSIVLGPTVLFGASDGSHGQELWRTDGTAAGTYLLKDINPGTGGSSPVMIAAANGWAYFSATDANGNELWKTDGTAANTVIVKDIDPGSGSSNPSTGVILNGILYFRAQADGSTYQLWRSDGTASGTYPLTSGASGVGTTSGSQFIAVVNNTIIFAGASDKLWRSDGTVAGTTAIGPSTVATVENLRASPSTGVVYFTCHEGNAGALYKTDGTTAGTQRVQSLPSVFDKVTNYLTDAGGTLYYVACDNYDSSNASLTHAALWKSDGTSTGTVQIEDIKLSGQSSGYSKLTAYNGKLAFVLTNASVGVPNLWITDGTPGNAAALTSFTPGLSQTGLQNVTVVNGLLYFSGDDGVTGGEPWVSNGTPGGTVMYQDVTPTMLNHFPQDPTTSGSRPQVFLSLPTWTFSEMTDDLHGREPWLIPALPVVTSAAYDPATSNVNLQTNVDVGASLTAGGVAVVDNTAGVTLAPGAYSLTYDSTTRRASLTFPGYPGGLPSGHQFSLTLKAATVVSAAGDQMARDYTFNFLTTATAPVAPSLSNPTANAMHVTWGAIPGATLDGYSVERSTDGVNFTAVGTIPATATSWDDTLTVPGVAYAYRVRGFRGSFATAASPTVTALRLDPAKATNNLYLKGDADGASIDVWRDTSMAAPQQPPTQIVTLSPGVPFSILGSPGDDAVNLDANVAPTAIQFPGGSGGSDSITVTSGAWQLDGDTPAGTPNVSVTIAASAAATFAAAQHLAGLTVNGSAQFTSTAKTFSVGSLAIGTGGSLDVGGNDLLTTAPADTVRQWLANGYANGAWNGAATTGNVGAIRSAAASAVAGGANARSLGYATSADVPTVPAGQTLVRFTTPADFNFSAGTDFNDFLTLQNHYNQAGNWTQGDANYDGKVDFNDFLILQNNYNHQMPPPPAEPVQEAAAVSASTPAPATDPTLTQTTTSTSTVTPPPTATNQPTVASPVVAPSAPAGQTPTPAMPTASPPSPHPFAVTPILGLHHPHPPAPPTHRRHAIPAVRPTRPASPRRHDTPLHGWLRRTS